MGKTLLWCGWGQGPVGRHLWTCEPDPQLARLLLSQGRQEAAASGPGLTLRGLSRKESELVALWLEEPTLAVASFSDQDSCGRNWSAQGFALLLQRPVNFAP